MRKQHTTLVNRRPVSCEFLVDEFGRRTVLVSRQYQKGDGKIYVRRGVGNSVAELGYEARIHRDGAITYGYGSTIEGAVRDLGERQEAFTKVMNVILDEPMFTPEPKPNWAAGVGYFLFVTLVGLASLLVGASLGWFLP